MQGSLPRKLRLLRAERGLTLAQAASGIGITRESLSLLERGKRRMRTPTLHKTAEFYGVSVEELMDLLDEEHSLERGESPPKGLAPKGALQELQEHIEREGLTFRFRDSMGEVVPGLSLEVLDSVIAQDVLSSVEDKGAASTNAGITIRRKGQPLPIYVEVGDV